MERLERLLPHVDVVALMPVGMARSVMLDVLAKEMGPYAEYSATIAAYLAPFIRRSTARAALGLGGRQPL